MSRRRIHLICNAHLDPVWQWRWDEGAAEALNTFRNAVEILEEHPDLIFNHNEAVLYEWVRRYDPLLFKHIQDLVRRRRWNISGGWYLQPDVNMPPIESIIRHIIEGRDYFTRYFGVRPTVAYNFDSFGHGGGLPQVLRQAGYDMYVHMRPGPDDLRLPSNLYRWRGVDGTVIPVYRIEVGLYHTEYGNIDERVAEAVNLCREIDRDVAMFWGIGDHGGGATRSDLETIDGWIQREESVDILHSTPEMLFDALKDEIGEAPIVEGDIQRIWTGTYTSLSRIKRRAQESLSRLVQTESLAAAAWWLRDADYPENALQEAWLDHLFNDFHDVLPGTCTEPAEQDALDIYGRAAESLRRVRLAAAVHFQQGPSDAAYLPVTVQNANPAARHVPVEVECMISHRPKWEGTWHLRLYTPDGREVPCQEEQAESLLPFNDWRRKVVFMTQLPAVGASSYRLQLCEGGPERPVVEAALAHTLDPGTGLISHLGGEANYLAGHLFRPLVVEDTADSWGTDVWEYREVVGAFEPTDGGACVVEEGPIRTVHQSTLRYERSEIIVSTAVYASWPVLEFKFRIAWHEDRKRLKLAVPTVFDSNFVECEVPGGIIRRPADGQEHVHGRWCLIEGSLDGSPAALGVVNSGQHGLDLLNGELRLSVLRSVPYCHHKDFDVSGPRRHKLMDQGIHEVRLLVTCGTAAEVRSRLPGLAEWLTAPPAALAHLPVGVNGQTSEGERGAVLADLLRITPEHVTLLACMPSADRKALLVRVQETQGSPAEARIDLAEPKAQIKLKLRPLEIKTVRIDRAGTSKAVGLVDETIRGTT